MRYASGLVVRQRDALGVVRRLDEDDRLGRLAERSLDLFVSLVPDQDERVAGLRVAACLRVHLRHERAGRVDRRQAQRSPPPAAPRVRCRERRRRRSRPRARPRARRRRRRRVRAGRRRRGSCGRSACGRRPALRRGRGPARPSRPPVRLPRNSLAARRGGGVSPRCGHDSRGVLNPREKDRPSAGFSARERPQYALQRWAVRPIVRPRKRSLPSLALGDANRGRLRTSCGEQSGEPAAPTPRAAGFSISGARFLAASSHGSVQSQRPVSTPGSFRRFARSAAPRPQLLLLRAILRRGGARQSQRKRDATREFESVSRVAGELARSADVEGVARTLLDELAELFGVGFVALTFVSDDGREAAGYLARSGGEDLEWWRGLRLDLEHEPSGIASAVFEATAFTVYDTEELGRHQSAARRRRRCEERRVRPAARAGARDRGDLRRDARRAAGLQRRRPSGDADARLGGGRRARAAARRASRSRRR